MKEKQKTEKSTKIKRKENGKEEEGYFRIFVGRGVNL